MGNAGPKCATTSMGHGKEILTLLIFTMSIWVRSWRSCADGGKDAINPDGTEFIVLLMTDWKLVKLGTCGSSADKLRVFRPRTSKTD